MKIPVSAIALSALLSLGLISNSEAESPVTVSTYFLTPTWLADSQTPLANPELSIRQGESWLPLESRWGLFGTEATASRLPEWDLRISLAKNDPDFSVTIKVPLTGDELLLIVLPERDNQFNVIPVDGTISKLPAGNVYFINAGDQSVAVNAGEDMKVLAVRETWTVPASTAINLQIKTRIAAQIKDKWRLVYRRTVFVNPQNRYIFLIHQRGLVGSAWTTTLLDFAPPPSPDNPRESKAEEEL